MALNYFQEFTLPFRKLNARWNIARTGKISRRPRNINDVYITLAKAG